MKRESEETVESKEARKLPFANDGSFLEKMKRRAVGRGIETKQNDNDEESRPNKKQAL